jgi:hypothetical protein
VTKNGKHEPNVNLNYEVILLKLITKKVKKAEEGAKAIFSEMLSSVVSH